MKYIPLEAIVYDASLVIPEDQFNKTKATELAARGYRKLSLPAKYVTNTIILEVIDHKALIPDNLVEINQIAYTTSSSLEIIKSLESEFDDESRNSELINVGGIVSTILDSKSSMWSPLKKNSSTFKPTNFSNDCRDCNQSYALDLSCCITTTFKNGYLLVSYLGHTVNENGEILIPDNDNLKEALVYYILYWNILSKKNRTKQDYADRDHYLQMWQTLSHKAVGQINEPTIDEMENIKNMTNRIIPKNMWRSFFNVLNDEQRTEKW